MSELDVAEPEQEEEQPEELDPEVKARRDAALARVRKLGDPVLRAKALPVEHFDRKLVEEVEHMGALMDDALGIGLAANQVGVLHRLLVYRADPDQPLTALANPQIEWLSEETDVAPEGCLSIPGVHVDVTRPARLRVSAQDPSGAPIQVEAEGLEARVIQHEIDHLDGVLILDRVSKEQRKQAMREMRQALVQRDA
jgi:peptide deformylase